MPPQAEGGYAVSCGLGDGAVQADQTLHNVTISGGRLEGISFLMVDSIDIKVGGG